MRCALTALAATTILFGLDPVGAWANTADTCTKALIPTTVNQNVDIYAATSYMQQIDSAAWSNMQRNAGAGATIYGIPLNISYSDFEAKRARHIEEIRYSNVMTLSSAYATSYLSTTSADAFLGCLNRIKGLSIWVDSISNRSFVVKVSYAVGGNETPTTRRFTSDNAKISGASDKYPNDSASAIEPESFIITPQNGLAESRFTFFVGSANETLVLPPLLQFIAKDQARTAACHGFISTYRVGNFGPGDMEIGINNSPGGLITVKANTTIQSFSVNNGPLTVKGGADSMGGPGGAQFFLKLLSLDRYVNETSCR